MQTKILYNDSQSLKIMSFWLQLWEIFLSNSCSFSNQCLGAMQLQLQLQLGQTEQNMDNNVNYDNNWLLVQALPPEKLELAQKNFSGFQSWLHFQKSQLQHQKSRLRLQLMLLQNS